MDMTDRQAVREGLKLVEDRIEETFESQKKYLKEDQLKRRCEEELKAGGKLKRASLIASIISGIFLATALTVLLSGVAKTETSGTTISFMCMIGCLFMAYVPFSLLRNGYIRLPENQLIQMILFLTAIFLWVPMLLLSVLTLVNAIVEQYMPVYIYLCIGPGGGIAAGFYAWKGCLKQLNEEKADHEAECAKAEEEVQKAYQNLQEETSDWYPAHYYSCNAVEAFMKKVSDNHLSPQEWIRSYQKDKNYENEIRSREELRNEVNDIDRDTVYFRRVNLDTWC